MSDLISRQAAIDALMNNEPSAWYNDDYERGEIARFHEDVTTIKNVPSVRRKRKPPAQPEPKSGTWIYDGTKRICPFCKDFIVTGRSIVKYCWNCGARLKERSKDDEAKFK